MPRQDANGTWISDDGLQYWDGTAWRPIGRPPAQARAGVSALPAVLVGCGFALVVVIVLVIGGILVFNGSTFRQSFCNSWQNNPQDSATPCPLQSSP